MDLRTHMSLNLAVTHGLSFVTEGVGFLCSLGAAKGDGVGDFIKRLVLGLGHKEEDENDCSSQYDGKHHVCVLL